MKASEIFEDKGSAQTFFSFIIHDTTNRLICNGVAPSDYYWSLEGTDGVKMSFRYREDAEKARRTIVK